MFAGRKYLFDDDKSFVGYTLFKMLIVRANLPTFFAIFCIRIKPLKEITFFVNAVTKHANSVTVFIVASLTVTVLTIIGKKL